MNSPKELKYDLTKTLTFTVLVLTVTVSIASLTLNNKPLSVFSLFLAVILILTGISYGVQYRNFMKELKSIKKK